MVNGQIHKEDHYPRVLMVLMTKVRSDDPGNLLIRSQFGDWPKDRLAQIHSAGDSTGHGEFCGHYYRLQACDRLLGRVFGRLRSAVFDMVATDVVTGQANAQEPGPLKKFAMAIRNRVSDWLVASGLWEIVFRIRLSKAMSQFIENFKPDLIYCQGYSLGFATLPLLVAKRFSTPICFQTTDDWPVGTYPHSPVGWLIRRRARELIERAKVRLAFGEKMRREYQCRYGVPFVVTYHLDDPTRFQARTEGSGLPHRITYTGSLGHRRYEAIQDLLAAVRQMPDLARDVEIVVHSHSFPKDMPADLIQSPEVRFADLPTHERLPSILANSTILLLPESFNEDRRAIEYSISTKAHLYMMSQRPVLVYGPPYSGTVGYAVREGWGLVVAERNVKLLREALTETLAGCDRVQQLLRNADVCFRRHHNMATERERFRQMMIDATHNSVTPDLCCQECT